MNDPLSNVGSFLEQPLPPPTHIPSPFHHSQSPVKAFTLPSLPIENPNKSSPEWQIQKERKTGFRATATKIGHSLEKKFTLLRKKIWTGEPTDGIKRIPSEGLQEQLEDLYALCQMKHKEFPNLKGMQFFDYGMRLAQEACPVDETSLETTKILLGKLIFVANRHFEEILHLSALSDTEHFTVKLESCFQEEISALKSEIEQHKRKHQATSVQDSEKAGRVFLPKVLAKTLMSSTGKVNIGIIDLFRDAFLPNPPTLAYEWHMAHVLETLKNSKQLRRQLESTRKPFSTTSPANHLIRITLGIHSGASVTDAMATQTVLAALLSHLRQENTRSCFATSLSIMLFSSHLSQCLDDFKNMIAYGKLTRNVGEMVQDFPFLMSIGDTTSEHILNIHPSGQLVNGTEEVPNVWDIPGIEQACLAMGITNSKRALQKVLNNLNHRNPSIEVHPIKVQHLLKEIALTVGYSSNINTTPFSSLVALGSFAFEAQMHNPLLRVWENAIAGMAEAQKNSYLKNKIVQSILGCLSEKLEELLPGPNALKEEIKQTIGEHLYERIQLQYDPTIQGKAALGGTFVLYDRENHKNATKWKRVDNAWDFQNFVSSIVLDIRKPPPNTKKSKIQVMPRIAATHALLKFVESREFISSCVYFYHPENQKEPYFMLPPSELNHTPWRDRTGNYVEMVLEVYYSKNDWLHTTIIPLDAESLLRTVLEISKQQHEVTNKNRIEMLPLHIPGLHACSLMLYHPTLSQALQEGVDIVKVGESIANSYITEETAKKLRKYTGDHFVKKEKKLLFFQKAQALKEELTVAEYRTALLQILTALGEPRSPPLRRAMCSIDTYLCQGALPEAERKQLCDSAIHFVDSNWSHGEHDVHFCFFFNPGSQKLELWKICEDGSNPICLNQRKWIQGKTWEFFYC